MALPLWKTRGGTFGEKISNLVEEHSKNPQLSRKNTGMSWGGTDTNPSRFPPFLAFFVWQELADNHQWGPFSVWSGLAVTNTMTGCIYPLYGCSFYHPNIE